MVSRMRVSCSSLALLAVHLLLTGFSAAQGVSLSRTSLNFSNHPVGTNSAPLNVILTNTDSTTPLALAVTASGDYSESDNCGGSVAPKGTCTLLVTFRPQSAGTINGVATLTDSANNSPQLITLTGNGVVPLTVSPASLTFGSVAVGSTSAPQTVTVTNNLAKSVSIALAASGDYIEAGKGTSPCGASLASKASCTAGVAFRPTVKGTINGSLTVTQNINSTPQLVALTGTGTGGTTPNLSFNPASVSFASTPLGVTSKKTVTVTNNSSKSITISAISAGGDFTATGGATSPCGGTLTGGNQCTITVSFRPTVTGTINGGLTITNTGSVKSIVLSLSGKGIVPVTVTPSSLSFSNRFTTY